MRQGCVIVCLFLPVQRDGEAMTSCTGVGSISFNRAYNIHYVACVGGLHVCLKPLFERRKHHIALRVSAVFLFPLRLTWRYDWPREMEYRQPSFPQPLLKHNLGGQPVVGERNTIHIGLPALTWNSPSGSLSQHSCIFVPPTHLFFRVPCLSCF